MTAPTHAKSGPPHAGRVAALATVFGAGAAMLLLENGLIRWLPADVRALAYFKNLVLLSTFLGLGVGALWAGRVRSLAWLFPIAFVAELWLALWFGGFVITQGGSAGEHLWLLYYDLPRDAPRFPLWGAVSIFFALNTLVFLPLGQWLGERLRAVGSAIPAYAADLAGSVVGTLAFVACSLAEWGPSAWFVPGLVVLAVLFRSNRLAAGLCGAAALAVAFLPLDRGRTWSPYYALSFSRIPPRAEAAGVLENPGVRVAVNGSYHQSALDLGAAAARISPSAARIREAYATPYRLLRERTGLQPKDVLVVGAGTGNDVQVALDHGAQRVDAVEIDPVILRWGRTLHPNRPYADPRVRTFATDARSFLQNTDRRYDLVVFGTLDSETQLSALSTIRLDNFVYTVESLKTVRGLLKPGGALALYFWAAQSWIRERQVRLVEAAFGHTPHAVFAPEEGLFNLLLVATKDAHRDLVGPALAASASADAEPPTDDWPYLYQRGRTLSAFYASVLALLALFSTLLVFAAIRVARAAAAGGRSRGPIHCALFFQGAAFMLLETNGISCLSLLFGSTWVVNAFVIGSILLLILAASLVVHRTRRPHKALILGGLAATLTVAYVVPPGALLEGVWWVRLALGGAVLLAPIFFSSLFFAVLLRESEHEVAWAYGSNLLGAVFGGLAEYLSVIVGFRALHLVALALFLAAALADRARPQGAPLHLPAPAEHRP